MKKSKREEESIQQSVPQSASAQPTGKGQSLLIQTAFVLTLFVIAIGVFVATYRMPEIPKAEEEDVLQITPFPNITNITDAVECKEVLFKAGEMDEYIYNFHMTGLFSFTSTIHSYYSGEEEYEGTKYKIRLMTTTMAGALEGTSTAKQFFDENWSCKFQIAEIHIGGRNFTQEVPCEEDIFTACADEYVFVRNESISVPAGQFTAQLWQSKDGESRIWIGDVPMPLKAEIGNVTLALVKYRRR